MSVPLPLVRSAVFATTNLFASIILGLSVYTFARTANYLGIYFTYSALGVATAVIHLASMGAMTIVGRLRDNAFTSRVSFQVGWLSYLSVMWLATGAHTAATIGVVLCTGSFCGATQAIAAFSFLNWIILFGYVSTLAMAAVRAGQAGNSNIWLTDVRELQWIPGTISYEKNDVNSSNPTVAIYPPGSNLDYSVPPVAPQSQPNYHQYGGGPPV